MRMSSHTSLCVSSFSPSGYEIYGKKFLESFVENVDADLAVYIEGENNTPNFHHPRVSFRNLLEVRGLQHTLAMTQFPAAKGQLWGGEVENYKFNIHKFCRKSFAQIDAAFVHANQGGSAVYWIDADVEFSGAFQLPSTKETFMLYLGRPEWHSCASFIGWNLEHPACKDFFNRYWSLYVSGTVFVLPEWHDSFIVDWLRQEMKLPAVNLAEGLQLKGFANVFDEVFPSAHHKKGALKYKEDQKAG